MHTTEDELIQDQLAQLSQQTIISFRRKDLEVWANSQSTPLKKVGRLKSRESRESHLPQLKTFRSAELPSYRKSLKQQKHEALFEKAKMAPISISISLPKSVRTEENDKLSRSLEKIVQQNNLRRRYRIEIKKQPPDVKDVTSKLKQFMTAKQCKPGRRENVKMSDFRRVVKMKKPRNIEDLIDYDFPL